ncbi:UvrD-helicase domain-containing protein [Streptomonospora nanhaiensis]|uniref:UvrD-helicase domain-containing protein n=1 Tax=Streptomonospora nanhaiensis TaxID=1323731 RepID=A0ABY6YTH8_9ACTN|nr:UvrD-helicase domain-containing protein [Streptomonospora nanhaiensis]WAE75513.1 UvrD-helicase domain-containing protein [Streptomonospora nanhaiensis]
MSADNQNRARAAQQAAVRLAVPAGGVVEIRACPGAGKTRVIVERHLTVPVPARKGRAVVSFTRVAGREIRRRCHEEGRDELLESPHFVGTLDTFLWRHLVRPYLSRKPSDRVWTRLESWSKLPLARHKGVSLDDFDYAFDARSGLHIGRATLRGRTAKGREFSESERRILEPWATTTIRALWEKGYFTGDLMRDAALNHLQDPALGALISTIVTSRFAEMIVDESQDCSKEDRAILHHLSAAGLPLVLVGDPDQSIYGFRSKSTGRPALPELVINDRKELTHNWRSSQTVCDLAAGLRVHERPADIATGLDSASGPPVLLLPHERGAGAEADFAKEAERLEIPVNERMLLAYNGSALPTRVGGTRRPPHSSPLGRLLWSVGTLRSGESPAARRADAFGLLKECLLDHWGLEGGGTERERLAMANVEPVELIRAASRVLRELPPLDDRTTRVWKEEAMKTLSALDRPSVHPRRVVFDSACPRGTSSAPVYKTAGFTAGVTGAEPIGRAGIIHQVKGEEADAVLVVMPGNAVALWEARGRRPLTRDEAETLRVYFVAVTRARKLVGLAVPPNDLDRAARVLHRYGVDHRRVRQEPRKSVPLPDALFDIGIL